MASDNKIVHTRGRILYVEPNDLYGNVDGVPLTPDYSDYCISVNLIAEVMSRQKQSGENATKEYIITWSSRPKYDSNGELINDSSANSWISFLQGQDAKLYKSEGAFLSTYYTDINYDDILKDNIVEGLGIESVQVSFESYYTPTIVIKFVDVRGSSLFGREEGVHDSNGNLTSSSVFGVFFTMPYPKFKLQIKGFYGHAVTYQLTCSDFRASFNSQNGNFEAVATFIGYSYSLLTDIPLRYLVAAPECKYVGEKYWDSKVNSPEWALSDGKGPIKLNKLIQLIRSLTVIDEGKLQESVMTNDEKVQKENINNEIFLLRNLSTTLADYKSSLMELTEGKYAYVKSDDPENDIEQLLLFSKKGTVYPTDRLIATSNNLLKAFEEYNTSFTNKEFSKNLLPNGNKGFVVVQNDKIIFTKICTVTYDDSDNITGVSFDVPEGYGQNDSDIMKITVKDRKISDLLAKKLYIDSNPTEEGTKIKKYFCDYGYLFDLNKFTDKINERLENLIKTNKLMNDEINLRVQDAARDVLGFTPYIGNVFKIIMCHLETFMHMMWECYHNIDNGDRSTTYLNVPLESTDFANLDPNKGGIGPWPGIFNNGKVGQQGGEIDSSMDGTIAWVGDFSHNFEEEKLVIELFKAVQRIYETKNNPPKPITSLNMIPVMPNDINNLGSQVFNGKIKNNLSSLSGYLSFRAAQILGILYNYNVSTELAMALGKMDAYNYFSANGSKTDINDNLLQAKENNNLETVLYDISVCSKDGDKFCENTFETTGKSRHDFETKLRIDKDYNNHERHPMFKDEGNILKYVHYYTKEHVGLVPDSMMEYEGYESVFPYKFIPNTGTEPYFEITSKDTDRHYEANGFLHKSSTKALFNNNEAFMTDYINDDMFSIEKSEAMSEGVIKKYNDLKSGTFMLFGDEFHDDFNLVLDGLWHVSPSDYGAFFKSKYVLSKGIEDLGMTEEDLYPDFKDVNTKVPKEINNQNWLETGDTGISYDVEKEGWVDKDGALQSVDSLFIRYIRSSFPTGNGSLGKQSLFGDPFYYVQNNILTQNSTNEEKYKVKCAKALLFLHCLNYDYKNIAGFLNKNKKCGGIYTIPYGYLLLLGGLLWRQRYADTHAKYENGKYVKDDPIHFNQGNNANDAKYRNAEISDTLFVESQSGQYEMCALLEKEKEASGYSYKIKVADLFGGGEDWMPDAYVTNKLITLFTDFVDNDWGMLMSGMELHNTSMNKNTKLHESTYYTSLTFSNECIKFKKQFESANMSRGLTVNGKPISKGGFMVDCMKNGQFFHDFFDKYKYIFVSKNYWSGSARGLQLLLNPNNTSIQNKLKELYTKKVTVMDSSGIRYSFNDNSDIREITINKDTFKSYLQGFKTKIEEIVNEDNNTSMTDETQSPEVPIERDLLLPVYMYLKILWDRWLASTPTRKTKNDGTINYDEYFNVKNFFKSFIFIDAYYKNIYNKFLINCNTIKDSYDGRDENGTLFQFIGDILDKHNCLFLALPDYVDMGSADNSKATQSMMDMFRPIPYNSMNGVEDENRFVIIYTPRMSEIPSSVNNYREDFIRIWNPALEGYEDKFDDKDMRIFNLEPANNNNNDPVTRYGYYVPSFGVAFSRQNNHLFKNINLNMTSPLVTSASIQAISRIAETGSGNQSKVAFLGQDLYPVFSNYSYICEIEMMGDAQVQPLMYFQLMNIPMWSGVYMIFNVTHSISAGNMTTRFKGMKLSKHPLPYNSSWYMFRPDNYNPTGYEVDNYENDGGSYNGRNDNQYIGVFNGNDSSTLQLVLNRTELTPYYTMGKLYIDGLFFCDTVEDMVRNISYDNCSKKVDKQTAIPYGTYKVSVKIPSGKFDVKYKTICGDYHVPMVMDVPCFTGIRIHKGVSADSSEGCIIVGDKSKDVEGRVINTNEVFKKLFPILKKAEIDDNKKIVLKIVNENIPRESDGINKDCVAENLKSTSLRNVEIVLSKLRNELKLTDAQLCGIAGNFVQESCFEPTTRQKGGGNAVGLAQWDGKRIKYGEEYLGKPIIEATLSEQTDFVIHELKTTEKKALTMLRKTVTAADAAISFCDYYERPGNKQTQNRVCFANLTSNYIKGNQIKL